MHTKAPRRLAAVQTTLSSKLAAKQLVRKYGIHGVNFENPLAN
jgi:acetate kinase